MLEQLIKFQVENKLSQADLARLLSCSESQVCRWINRKHKIGRAWSRIIQQIITNHN